MSLLVVLRQRREGTALPAAPDALRDGEKAVRAAAIAAVGASRGKDDVPALIRLLSGGDPDESLAAQNALKSMGDGEVADCLDDPDLPVEASAAAIRMGSAMPKRHKAEVAAAMKKVLEVTKDERLRKQAADLARKARP